MGTGKCICGWLQRKIAAELLSQKMEDSATTITKRNTVIFFVHMILFERLYIFETVPDRFETVMNRFEIVLKSQTSSKTRYCSKCHDFVTAPNAPPPIFSKTTKYFFGR